MLNRIENHLSEDLLHLLQSECYVTLSTIDAKTLGPSVHAISWIYAKDTQTILFAADKRSRLIENIKANHKIAITLIGNDSTYTVYGEAKVVKEKIEDISFPVSLVNVQIDYVRDVMFYGAKISMPPLYEKTYDEQAAKKLDNQVMNAMKKLSLS